MNEICKGATEDLRNDQSTIRDLHPSNFFHHIPSHVSVLNILYVFVVQRAHSRKIDYLVAWELSLHTQMSIMIVTKSFEVQDLFLLHA